MQVLEIRPNSRCCKLQGTVEGYQATTGKALARVSWGALWGVSGQGSPGSTCPRLFSLREGTFACLTPSNLVVTHRSES